MPTKPPTLGATKKKRNVFKKRNGPRVYDKQSWRGPNGIRQSKLKQNPLCEECERNGLIVAASHVDHVDGDATNMDPDNLRSLCVPCHSRKTVAHDGGFGNKKAKGRGV